MSFPTYKDIREEHFNKKNDERKKDETYINMVFEEYYINKMTQLINISKKDIIDEKLDNKIYIRNSDMKNINNPESVCNQMGSFFSSAGYDNIEVRFKKTFFNTPYCHFTSVHVPGPGTRFSRFAKEC